MNSLKVTLLAGAAALAFSGIAQAADPIMPIPVAPVTPIATVDNWTGFYAGVNAGYGFGQAYSGAVQPFAGFDNLTGLLGGAQIGANFQQDMIVFGLETDIQASGVSQTVGRQLSLDYFGTVRARVGVDLDGVMPYVTGGLAYGQASLTGPAESQFHTGWTAGGGVEFKMDQSFSLKGEYLYTDMGERNYATVGAGTDVGVRFHTVRVGANFHF